MDKRFGYLGFTNPVGVGECRTCTCACVWVAVVWVL